MYGLATIRRMNEEAGERAREEGIEPFLLEDASELDGMPPFPFPNVGDGADDLDERLERVDSLFCDSSGFGSPGEPALTVPQLLERLHDLDYRSADDAAFGFELNKMIEEVTGGLNARYAAVQAGEDIHPAKAQWNTKNVKAWMSTFAKWPDEAAFTAAKKERAKKAK